MILARLRENGRCSAVCVMADAAVPSPVHRTLPLLQGELGALGIFKAMLDLAATAFCGLASRDGWGYRLDDVSYVSVCCLQITFDLFLQAQTNSR